MSATQKQESGSIQFFGAVDKTKEGRITSEYPAWTFPRQIENFDEEILRKERALESGIVPRDNIHEHMVALDRDKARRDEIVNSKPSLSSKQKDTCAKIYSEVGTLISDSMSSYSDMQRLRRDAHKEYGINNTPSIKLPPEAAKVAHDNGIKITNDRMISREGASRLWKLCGHAIEKETNVEYLRKMK